MIFFLKMAGIAIFLLFSLLPARAGRHIVCQNKERPVSKVVPLPDLINPTGIQVADGRIFITEESSVSIYSVDDYRLLNTFGRQGEGPGEFKYPPYLIPRAGHLLILNFDRILNYSWDGEFLEERKVPLNYNYWIFPLLPVGENYIGFPVEPVEGKGFGHIGRLYDRDFKPIKKVYDFVPSLIPPPPPPPRPGEKSSSFPKQDLEAIPDCFDVSVAGDKFFIADTRQGFFIAVLDAQGNPIYDIHRDFKKTRVTKEYRDAYMKELQEQSNWESLNNRYDYVFKDTFPAFFSYKTVGKKIFCITYNKKDSHYEIVVLDLEGKLEGRFFSFPLAPYQRSNETFLQYSNEFAIFSDTIYHLEYNDSRGNIELHLTAIK